MMPKKLFLAPFLVLLILLGATDSPAQVTRLSIGTASVGGVFFPLGTGMAKVITKYVPGVDASAESTAGSAQNVRLVGAKKTDLGLAMSDIAYDAFHGRGKFSKEKYDNLRGLLMVYGQMMHILVRADSPIKSIADLRGKKVSVGPAGSGTEFMSKLLLEAYGITYKDLKVDFLTHEEESMALADKNIEAAFYLMGPPASAIVSFLASHKGRFIPIEKTMIDKLHQKFPFYTEMPIPANAYPAQVQAVPSVGVRVVFLTNTSLSDKFAFEITKALIEHREELIAIHPSAKEITLADALAGMPIPLHSGAKKYYAEKKHPGLAK